MDKILLLRSKKLIKNIGMMLTGSFIAKAIGFFMVPLYTSVLTPSDYGTADLINNTICFLLPLFSLLMDEAIIRFSLDKSADKKQIFTSALTVSSIGYLILIALSTVAFIFNFYTQYYFFFILYYTVSWIYNLCAGYAKGTENILAFTVSGIVNTVTFLSCNVFFLVFLETGLIGYLLAISISSLCAAIYLFFTCRIYNSITFPKPLNLTLIKSLLTYSIPIIPEYITWWVNSGASRYILSYFSGVYMVGIYSIAYKIPTLITVSTSIFTNAWRISSAEEFGSKNSIVFYNEIYKNYSSFLCLSATILILCIKPLASILFIGDFYLAWKIAPILILTSVYSALSQFVASIYTASKITKKICIAPTISAFINFFLSMILIPNYHATGAALATLISFFIMWVVNIYITRKIIILNLITTRLLFSHLLIVVEILAILNDSFLSITIANCSALILILLNRDIFLILLKTLTKKYS